MRDGKTSRQILVEQLSVLDAEMKTILDEVNRDNISALQAHGRFLNARFAKSDTFLS